VDRELREENAREPMPFWGEGDSVMQRREPEHGQRVLLAGDRVFVHAQRERDLGAHVVDAALQVAFRDAEVQDGEGETADMQAPMDDGARVNADA
jgi:hypothetical protein